MFFAGSVRQAAPQDFLHEGFELIESQATFPDDTAQCSFCEFLVVGDRESSMWRVFMPEDNVASFLVVPLIANFG